MGRPSGEWRRAESDSDSEGVPSWDTAGKQLDEELL